VSGAPGYPSTIGRVLTRSATRLPDKLALTFAGRRWTYAELDRASGKLLKRELRDQLRAPAAAPPS
jgi:fatty-acyl-CoA synthase